MAGEEERLAAGLGRMYDLFEKAPALGSLVDPRDLQGNLYEAAFSDLQVFLQGVSLDQVEDLERAVVARSLAEAAGLLGATYGLVVTNYPYLGRGAQGGELRGLSEERYDSGKADLATVFIERSLAWLGDSGVQAVVVPQNWMFLASYRGMRGSLLREKVWHLVATLGPGAFESIGGQVVNVALLVLGAARPRRESLMGSVDAASAREPTGKAAILKGAAGTPGRALGMILQSSQLRNPDCRVQLRSTSEKDLLSGYAESCHGVGTFDSGRFRIFFWEVEAHGAVWVPQQTSPSTSQHWDGCHYLLRWESGCGGLSALMEAWQKEGYSSGKWRAGVDQWGRDGVVVGQMGDLPATLYAGYAFDENASLIFPEDSDLLPSLWCFLRSSEFRHLIREVDRSLKVTCKALVKVPFDPERWTSVAGEEYPSGLPAPQSNCPKQWIFHGQPTQAESPTVLQVAVARLLGYRWPAELDSNMRLAGEARRWVGQCDALIEFADEDGIVCFSSTCGERPAADRLRDLLAAAFGSTWGPAKERELVSSAGGAARSAESLETWLRDRFFEEHCKFFHSRPFIWHLWDGQREGFHCLVNVHKLTGPDGVGLLTLKSITYSYLGDWIGRQKADQRDGKEGADGRLAAALHLQGELEKIIEGEPPYDLFVRWKPLHEQAMGWQPDINDGVRLNIRPFMNATLRKGGKKGAGILRAKPTIHWKKDRGKEPRELRPREQYPWFWGFPGDGSTTERTDFAGGKTFDGNRWNDVHYTLEAKRRAREAHGGEGA